MHPRPLRVLLRAIAARLQAEYIPPLRPISLGRTRTQQVACLPRARGRCPEGAEEVHERTGINMTRLRIFTSVVARARGRCPEGTEEVHERTGINMTRLRIFTSVIARARGRCRACGTEEVHGRAGKNNTRLQVLANVVAPRTGAKRGMPGAFPEKVARRAGRGPWTHQGIWFN